MKFILRNLVLNMAALMITAHFVPGLIIEGGIKGLTIGSIAFMVANLLLTPFLKVVLLPLNILTLGLFAWLSNVLTLYLLVSFVPTFKLIPYTFEGSAIGVVSIPPYQMSAFHVAIASSFVIGLIIHLTHWLFNNH